MWCHCLSIGLDLFATEIFFIGQAREGYIKSRAFTESAFHPSRTAHRFHAFLHNVKTKASAADGASFRIIRTIKFLKNMFAVFWRNANTGICHINQNTVAIATHIHPNATPIIGVFNRIFDQIINNLTQKIHIDRRKNFLINHASTIHIGGRGRTKSKMNIFLTHLRNLTFRNRTHCRGYLNRQEVRLDSFIIKFCHI